MKTIYLLHQNHETIAAFSNFKALYDTVQKFRSELEITGISSYSTAVAFVKRSGKFHLSEPSSNNFIFVSTIKVHRKELGGESLLSIV